MYIYMFYHTSLVEFKGTVFFLLRNVSITQYNANEISGRRVVSGMGHRGQDYMMYYMHMQLSNQCQ